MIGVVGCFVYPFKFSLNSLKLHPSPPPLPKNECINVVRFYPHSLDTKWSRSTKSDVHEWKNDISHDHCPRIHESLCPRILLKPQYCVMIICNCYIDQKIDLFCQDAYYCEITRQKAFAHEKKNKSIAHDTVKFDIAQCTIMLYALNIHVLLHVIGMNKKDEQTKLWNPWQSIPRGSDVWLVFINIIGP